MGYLLCTAEAANAKCRRTTALGGFSCVVPQIQRTLTGSRLQPSAATS